MEHILDLESDTAQLTDSFTNLFKHDVPISDQIHPPWSEMEKHPLWSLQIKIWCHWKQVSHEESSSTLLTIYLIFIPQTQIVIHAASHAVNLCQYVTVPTHDNDHCIDYII